MTKILPVFTFVLWAASLSAQITITADDSPDFGRFLVSATDTTITELSIGAPSAQPQEWTFLELDEHSRIENTVTDPAETPSAADFPDATFAFVTADSQYAYAQVTDSALFALGGTASVLLGFPPLTVAFDNPQLLLTAPATYGTTFNDIYRIAATVAGADFGIDADSIRFVRTAAIQAEVDAFGTLTVPGGTYEVLRLRTEVLTVDSISIKVFGTFFPLPGTPIVSETVNYEWWGKEGVGIVMSVDEDEEGILTEATFLTHSSDMPVGPGAAFSAEINAEGLVSFDNMSSGSASSFEWDFGDGTVSTVVHPQHTYGEEGIYTVCLTARNSVGEDVTCEEVDVAIVSADQLVRESVRLVVFPSPASGSAQLMLDGLQGERLWLHGFDALGRQVWQREFQEAPDVINLPVQHWVPGLYRLVARTAYGQRVVTFSLQ